MKSNKVALMARRKAALSRLKDQLKRGTKPERVALITLYTTGANQLPLEKQDIQRIQKEISILESKT